MSKEPAGAAPKEAGKRGGDRLLANKERILTLWEERLRKEVAAAAGESHPILINTLPALLRQLAEALSPKHPRRTATEGSTVAEEHGGERVRMTHFRLEDVIAEYKLLREVLFAVLEEKEPLAPEERNILNASLDQVIAKSCTAYVLVQEGFREQLFATLAHDLRSPLSAAKVNASLILRKPSAEHVPRWAVRTIDSIDRVDRMIQDLLDAMRVQAGGRLPLELEDCDLVDVVRQSVEHLEAEHGERFVLVAPEPVRGYFASKALQRAVENLGGNAVKYGATARPITVTVRQAHGRAFIVVHNHGGHIPVEQQETLFRAFQRLPEAEKSGRRGWGLGLAQVRGVAEAHGGSIAVDSLPERGTSFTVDIPKDARPFEKSR
ncbi:HAMP domain-containing sensor histidine kinase [Hyalangium sp.]|uniref:sensor histidine kinase n=1 Tax=Hyalangium sp. TaxID=2028555 RepID=UPI002D6E3A91|nr:HAMP domain-containing sensor histidine kinase [Hyalangium sp.]HYH97335.1 HAMP domain-containing sensor histidine kinase [Hyalangium sp.]